jgi:hypothetical protein
MQHKFATRKMPLMDARPVFFFALIFTLLNLVAGVVMEHVFPFVVAVFGLMIALAAASKVWPDVVRSKAITEDEHRDNPAYDHLPSNVFWDGE